MRNPLFFPYGQELLWLKHKNKRKEQRKIRFKWITLFALWEHQEWPKGINNRLKNTPKASGKPSILQTPMVGLTLIKNLFDSSAKEYQRRQKPYRPSSGRQKHTYQTGFLACCVIWKNRLSEVRKNVRTNRRKIFTATVYAFHKRTAILEVQS